MRLCDVRPDERWAARVAEICNEPAVYDTHFRERWSGRPYSANDALAFRAWAEAGWTQGTHFVFMIQAESGEPWGAADFKSADNVPEIGYWASERARGAMTNALTVLLGWAAEAGVRAVQARTRASNVRSQLLLGRLGFAPVETHLPDERRFARAVGSGEGTS